MNLNDCINKSGYYAVKVIPNQPATEVKQIMADGTLKIAVAAAPEKGKANEELIRFLSDELAVDKAAIRISAGLTSRKKVVYIEL